MQGYYFDENNNFIIEDYHKAKTFSSFLPGIAGEAGIPIWSFYVNRGQGISGFGIQDKNSPIMEFFPANSSYQYVSTYGFRTFIKDVTSQYVYEPFKENYMGYTLNSKSQTEARTKMTIMKDSFSIEDTNKENELPISVTYSTLSNVPFGGLIRSLEIVNTSDEVKHLELIDGMPALLPYGVENKAYKEMSNLMRSWMEVSHTDQKIPYYKLRSSTNDDAVVSISESGYFYMNENLNNDECLTIYDPSLVFAYQTDLQTPVNFIHNDYERLKAKNQVFANKVPSAFQLLKVSLKPGEKKKINSIIGFVSEYELIESYTKDIDLAAFVERQMNTTKAEIETLCNDIKTKTNIKAYDEYMKQTYLDNILRGGKPIFFEGKDKDHVYHIYSRKHGDPERDYNFFSLEPSKYSQGNGNYRDVCQNRRNDVIMDPKVKDFNIWMFYNLIQADGYNPLSIKGTKFSVSENERMNLKAILSELQLVEEDVNNILLKVSSPFTPGDLIKYFEDYIQSSKDNQELLKICLNFANQDIDVDFGEGFWSDHFTYNLDLIESYEFMYPDQMKQTFLMDYKYKFYNAPYYVVPRAQKYNLLEENVVRQYKSIAKKNEISSSWLSDTHNNIIHTSLLNKLLVLSLTKFLNLDPFAMGIEMEGDKPGWNDALNGLPGLLGSGMSETIELKRCVDYLIKQCDAYLDMSDFDVLEDIIKLFESIAVIVKDINIEQLHKEAKISYYLWNELNTIKEAYRNKTKYNMSSNHEKLSIKNLKELLINIELILRLGIEKSMEYAGGVVPSYFVNEVKTYEHLNTMTPFGRPAVRPLSFEHRPLPLFLEAPARYLKNSDPINGKKLYSKVKETGIYDQELSMYKTSASLDSETHEIGRIRAFTPGWLERESVFLHMTYKYLLGILEAGLYDEYYEEIKTNLVPMLDPSVYGRSTTENSSFIASSVNPDPSVIGQGFVARLSGSTAEAISMWIKMFIGNQGFSYNNKQLSFRFDPKLSVDFFDNDGKVSFMLFGCTKVTYINPTKKHTYGENSAVINNIKVDKQLLNLKYLDEAYALDLRDKKIQEIEITFK